MATTVVKSGNAVKPAPGTEFRAVPTSYRPPPDIRFTLSFIDNYAHRLMAKPLSSGEMLVFIILVQSVQKGNAATLTYTELCEKLPNLTKLTVSGIVAKLKRLGYLEPTRKAYRVNMQLFWRGKLSEWQEAMEEALEAPMASAAASPAAVVQSAPLAELC